MQIISTADKYSALRALAGIDRSDVVLLVIDADAGIQQQDKHVVGYAYEANKAIIIVVNKWDLIERSETAMNEFKKKVRDEFKFLDFAPIVFVSAKNKSRIQTIFSSITLAHESYCQRISTSILNEIMEDGYNFSSGHFSKYAVIEKDNGNNKFPIFLIIL